MTARALHLVGRFCGSLVPRRLSTTDEAWVAAVLTAHELALWRQLPRADKVEALGVARRAHAQLDVEGQDALYDYLAAALLHDVGKIDADLGSYRRAIATIAGAMTTPATRAAWAHRGGFARRCALYLDHAALGATRIRVVGGRERAAQWAGAHHDPNQWPTPAIPIAVCRTLARADGERVPDQAVTASNSSDGA